MWFSSKWKTTVTLSLACVVAISFPFPDRDWTSERNSEQAKEHDRTEQKIVKELERVSKKGGWGEKESPTVNPKHFTKLCLPMNAEQWCNLIGYSGPKINFFRQAPTGNWNVFFSRQMEKCGRQKELTKCFLSSETQIVESPGRQFFFREWEWREHVWGHNGVFSAA